MRRRRLWLALIGLLLVLVAGDTLAWYLATQRLRAGLDAWAAANRAAGWTISYDKPRTGGWPYAAALYLRDLRLQSAAPPMFFDWQAGRATLRLTILHPATLQLLLRGAQQASTAEAPPLAFAAARFVIDIPLRAAAPPWQLSWHAEQWHTLMPDGATVAIGRLVARTEWDPGASKGQAALALTVQADAIDLPSHYQWALGRQIAKMSFHIELNGPLGDNPNPTAAATAWRDAGGALQLQGLNLQWGPLGLQAKGRANLDSHLQPAGDANAKANGYSETLDALVRAGVMQPSAALTAKALLSLLASAPDDGSPPAVDVPLSLHDNLLTVRQLPLLRVPKLDWPPG